MRRLNAQILTSKNILTTQNYILGLITYFLINVLGSKFLKKSWNIPKESLSVVCPLFHFMIISNFPIHATYFLSNWSGRNFVRYADRREFFKYLCSLIKILTASYFLLNVWSIKIRTIHKLSLLLYYDFFGKSSFHIASFSSQDL